MLQQANKKGISLIILVITIIIIIILAGAVIVALNNSGVITKAKLAKESSEFTSIREAVELERQNMLLTGTFDKNKINIPEIYEDDIEVTATGEILIKYNAATKITDIANAVKILGALYISNGFDEIQSISGGTVFAGETKLAKIIIEGKSEQTVTTQGKNLFDINKKIEGYFSIDTTNEALNVNVTNTWTTPWLPCKPNTQYTSSGGNRSRWQVKSANGTIAYKGGSPDQNAGVGTITTNADSTMMRCYFASETFTGNFNIQIEEGSTATAYQTFVPNSPSPDYPSTINNVSDFDIITTGKNLFSLVDLIPTSTIVKTDTGLKLNGYQCVGNYQWGKYLKPNTSYRVSFYYTGIVSDASGSIRMYKSTSPANVIQIGKASASNTWVSAVFTTPSDINLYNSIWAYGNGEASYIQIEQNTDDRTDYEDHKSQILNLLYTLRSLPDGTKDYIEIDNVNKTSKLVQNITEVIADGSTDENWLVHPSYGNEDYIVYYNNIGFSSNIIDGIGKSSHFPLSRDNTFINGINAEAWYTNTSPSRYICVKIKRTTVGSVDALRTWLAANPVTFQGRLATPIVTDLTYQELSMEYPIINIYTTSTVKPRIIGQVINK